MKTKKFNTIEYLLHSKTQNVLITVLFTLFAVMVFGRLSAFTDVIFSSIGLDLFNRVQTKLVWLLFYVLSFIFVIVVYVRNRVTFKELMKKFLSERKNELIAFAVFSLLLIITVPFSFKISESLMGVAYYLILISIPVFIWFVLLGIEKHIIQKGFYRGIVAITVILFLFSILEYWAYSNGGVQNFFVSFFDSHGGFMPISFFTFEYGGETVIRPSSLMGDPNFLAVFLSSLMLFNIDFLIKKFHSEKRLDWIMAIVFILNLGNLLITGSRTGIIVFVVELVIYFCANFIFTRKLLVAGFFTNLFTRFQDAISLKDSSTLQHIDFARIAIDMFLKNPIFGVGIANYPYYYWEYYDNDSGFATPHSVFFQFLAETGIIGSLGFLGLLVFLIQRLVRKRNVLYLAVLSGLLVGNITYDYFMTPWVWFYIGLMLF